MKISVNGLDIEVEENDRVISAWVATSKELQLQQWRDGKLVYDHDEKL